MSVTTDDVRHIAGLARLGLDERRIPTLVAELNGILEHMAVLEQVKTARVPAAGGVGAEGQPLRVDHGPPYALARPRDAFAPQVRDGFLLVPRLATHEDVDAALDAEAP